VTCSDSGEDLFLLEAGRFFSIHLSQKPFVARLSLF